MTNPPPPPASAMGLCEKWRNDNGDYPDSKRDCADELEELLTPELAESLQYIRMNGVEFTTNCDIENMREFIARALGIHRITGETP